MVWIKNKKTGIKSSKYKVTFWWNCNTFIVRVSNLKFLKPAAKILKLVYRWTGSQFIYVLFKDELPEQFFSLPKYEPLKLFMCNKLKCFSLTCVCNVDECHSAYWDRWSQKPWKLCIFCDISKYRAVPIHLFSNWVQVLEYSLIPNWMLTELELK